jgi:FtsP/CotA-like multicopper oxidase with cupredoxin domain
MNESLRKRKNLFAVGALALSIALLAGCTKDNNQNDMSGMVHSNMSDEEHAKMTSGEANSSSAFEVLKGTKFDLVAKESHLEIDKNIMRTAWTINGTVPGPQLRVPLGQTVEVDLKNELKEPVTLHWHGVPVPNEMDGIPGVTMNAVQPGESFTYKFKATVSGTYWYHTHQNGVVQLDKGLYGTLIIEDPNEEPADRDYTVVLDEWTADENMNHSDSMDMSGHGDSMTSADTSATSTEGSMNMPQMSDAEMMPLMYTIFTANGKSGSAIAPLQVKEGETVRIRLINAGFLSHPMHLQGHDYKIMTTDGQPINNPPLANGQLLNIAPGERYDIEFTANNPGNWLLEEHSNNPGATGMAIPILYEGATGDIQRDHEPLPVLDITKYGEAAKGKFSLSDSFDLEYTMDLNSQTDNGIANFTINNKMFPDTDPMVVKEGELVKVTLVNNSPKDVHPMHLHGHFFQVLSKNGQPISGSPIVKDTLNILPGESYVVAFEADNAGNWLFHCHDLGHASKGMVTSVKYEGYEPHFKVDPNAGNKPE